MANNIILPYVRNTAQFIRLFSEDMTRARICKCSRIPGIDSASLCSLAGWYDNPTCTGIDSLESIPGLLIQIWAQAFWLFPFPTLKEATTEKRHIQKFDLDYLCKCTVSACRVNNLE